MPPYRPADERFWEKVVEDDKGCWLWVAGKDPAGYGVFNLPRGGGTVRAHRWSYEHLVSEIPDGLVIDHLCRVPACVNPWHCDPVTDEVNVRRGKKWRGETCAQGHDLSEAYFFVDSRGFTKRVCRPCRNKRLRIKYQEKKREKVQ